MQCPKCLQDFEEKSDGMISSHQCGVKSNWKKLEDEQPAEDSWCWISDGEDVLLARRDRLYANGWLNDDTWEDYNKKYNWWQYAEIPEPPKTNPRGDAENAEG